MQVQSISNNQPSFGALNITAEARAIIEKEKGGAEKIIQYTKELANSRWDLNIRKSNSGNSIYPLFGKDRDCCVIPCHLKDEFVMVYSSDAHSCDTDDDITDCLKFSCAQKAKEVYETLKKHFHANNKTPLQKLDWHVYAMKAFTEAEIVPQTRSPWAHFLYKTYSSPAVKPKTSVQQSGVKKAPFLQRLQEAWKVLLGK